jgi:hypothetical protein
VIGADGLPGPADGIAAPSGQWAATFNYATGALEALAKEILLDRAKSVPDR